MTTTTQPVARLDIEELEDLVRACPDDTGMGYCAACSYTIGQCACATRYQFRYGTKKPTVLALIAEVRELRGRGWIACSEGASLTLDWRVSAARSEDHAAV